ncbi:hypothetical protein TNCV_3224321 [Trichonephila clavipes]|nr:hypothetical protein TNCV_3224321 [Trichonephila clavipes]
MLTEAYGDKILSRVWVSDAISGFQEEETVWKMMNMLGALVKSSLKRTHFTSNEEVQAKTENFLKGLPKKHFSRTVTSNSSTDAKVCEG